MRCPGCGFDNPLGAKFCGRCGAMLGLRCPRCGAANPPEVVFCANCGAAMNEKRLTAVPWTPYCVECQELSEKGLLEG